MGLIFVGYLAVPILIGVLAQAWKGRTGIAWGSVTLILMVGVWLFAAASGVLTSEEIAVRTNEQRQLVNFLTVGSVTFVIMALVVATLPDRRSSDPGQ
ncbi:hypothetical protein [Roseibium sediminicola]|uniref:Uncharacterized protein n=1 Tax=Roseibium sediminicola TaxID=2933272 RepID=A0ABT0H0H1_9HYPH|nr:hypothetical protein [Roseibium sp. CAU 1639]MCK7615182.1 hypothetical protein [Roseibium sp. CAU 1639]